MGLNSNSKRRLSLHLNPSHLLLLPLSHQTALRRPPIFLHGAKTLHPKRHIRRSYRLRQLPLHSRLVLPPRLDLLLLYATQLAFIAVFARIIVKQKFTPYSINSVVLMTLGAIILGLRADGDRPPGVSNKEYLIGFFLTVVSAALIGFIWPCIELCYARARTLNYIVVLQFQLNIALFASIFSLVGMAVNKDFQAIKREANEYGLGRHMYLVVLVCGAVAWQLAFIGGLGLIYCVGSLFNGVLTSLLLPMTEVAAVIAYHEKFNGEKGMSLALCLWGFTSYFYGEYQNSRKVAKTTQVGSVGA
ncbi:hypothetical protein Scep_002630 [Stephania cephalantha]|uniref:Probable purine permease n=1 Tax=Stephania cephalantha TaxID=152367 RepID=A0AAP0Q635_9MAGN